MGELGAFLLYLQMITEGVAYAAILWQERYSIKYMKYYFNGTCNGSIELLSSRELDLLARNIRSGSEIIC